MEVTSINYFGNNGWKYCTDFTYTPSSQLHIPRVGDTIQNRLCEKFKVVEVTWKIPTNSIVIDCELISE